MLNSKKELQMMFDEFCYYNPSLVNAVVDWYPCGHLEIVIKLDSEEKLIYDYISKTTRQVCKSYLDRSEVDYHSEQDFIDAFSWRLTKHIKAAGLTRAEVAKMADITPSQLSNYTNGKSLPNTYTLYKLAAVLKCTPSELLWVK